MKSFYQLFFILAISILADAVEEDCGEQIDAKIAELRTKPDIPIVLDIAPPNVSCLVTGLTRMTRDPSKPISPENTVNGTTYVVTIMVDEVYVKCDVNVSSKLTELPGTLVYDINYINKQLFNNCPILTYGPDAIQSGLNSNPLSFSAPSVATCMNATGAIVKNPVDVAKSIFGNDTVKISLVGSIKNFTYSPTIVIQNNSSTLRGFNVGEVDSKNFKMWCEDGNSQSSTLKDTCTCLCSSNVQKSFMVGILSFFLTCYPNADAYTEGAYAKIADALTCNVQ